MSKRNRGKALKNIPSRGRGSCPQCSRDGIKLLYNKKTTTNENIKVCKYCRDKM